MMMMMILFFLFLLFSIFSSYIVDFSGQMSAILAYW